MEQSDVFHLGLTFSAGATLAIVPGDPLRVEKIARLMANPVHLATHREFTTWRAELAGKAVVVCSTGIGGSSTSIALEELSQPGIRTFLRVGITDASQHFAPLAFPAVADFPAPPRWGRRRKRAAPGCMWA